MNATRQPAEKRGEDGVVRRSAAGIAVEIFSVLVMIAFGVLIAWLGHLM